LSKNQKGRGERRIKRHVRGTTRERCVKLEHRIRTPRSEVVGRYIGRVGAGERDEVKTDRKGEVTSSTYTFLSKHAGQGLANSRARSRRESINKKGGSGEGVQAERRNKP